MRLNPFLSISARSDLAAEFAALGRSTAVISFNLDGTIIDANENFLKTMGYSLEQLRGQHHRLFVDKAYAASVEYQHFWDKLGRGEYAAGQFPRVAADGREVWIEASYNPVLGRDGKPRKIVKFATVITAQKEREADMIGKIDAIGKVMAVIEFSLDGHILTANPNFLAVTGYALSEIVGQHHGMFCAPDYRRSDAYRDFWQKLGRGEYDRGQYQRFGKDGREFWVEASYNPIFDAKGRPMKVVKYATDVTEQKAARQLALAVTEAQSVIAAAKGRDLTTRIALDGKVGEVATLCEGINALIDTMAEVVSSVSGIAGRVGSAADRIAADGVDLAQRTETQASSLQQTAATTEELAASIKTSAGHSRQAAALGGEAKAVASRGGMIVADAVAAMERIETASASIAAIISMIDEISFQTNLLALNAAVEAARAGDTGRGFAVVASEVRELAKRSGQSAAGVKELIANSSEQVRNGVKLVKDAGQVLGEIVDAASRVASTVTEISSATSEQAGGVEEMARTVAHMDEMTQQNSLLADGSSRLSRELLDDTRELNALVCSFRLPPRAADPSAALAAQLRGVVPAMRAVAAPRSAPRTVARTARAASGCGGWSEF